MKGRGDFRYSYHSVALISSVALTVLAFYAFTHFKRGVLGEYLPAFAIAFTGLVASVIFFLRTKDFYRFLSILVLSSGAPIYFVLIKGGVNPFDYAWVVVFFSVCYMILPLKRANLVASFYFALVTLTLVLGELKVINIPSSLSEVYPILLASLIVILIANSAMREFHEWVNKQVDFALHDSLTGLYNRGVIAEILSKETEAFKRSGVPMCILLVDVDHFKSINDTYGHSTGDMVLRTIARILSRNLRSGDSAGRWGGEEFLVILPGTTLDGGLNVAKRLLSEIRRETETSIGITVTVSIGVACLEGGDDPEGLVDKADKALYEAKRRGRNRVVCFESL